MIKVHGIMVDVDLIIVADLSREFILYFCLDEPSLMDSAVMLRGLVAALSWLAGLICFGFAC